MLGINDLVRAHEGACPRPSLDARRAGPDGGLSLSNFADCLDPFDNLRLGFDGGRSPTLVGAWGARFRVVEAFDVHLVSVG